MVTQETPESLVLRASGGETCGLMVGKNGCLGLLLSSTRQTPGKNCFGALYFSVFLNKYGLNLTIADYINYAVALF